MTQGERWLLCLKTIFLRCRQLRDDWFAGNISPAESAIGGQLASAYQYMDDERIEFCFKQQIYDLLHEKRFIHLKPFDSNGTRYPVVTLNYDFTTRPEKFSLKLVVFEHKQASDERRGVGFRFEMPEGEGEGIHNYAHAQMIFELEKDSPDGPYKINGFDHVPDDQPAFPLDAVNPVELTIAMLVSCYGPRFMGELTPEERRTIIGTITCPACVVAPFPPQITHPNPGDGKSLSSLSEVRFDAPSNPFGKVLREARLYLIREGNRHYFDGQSWRPEETTVKSLSPVAPSNNAFDIRRANLSGGDYTVRIVLEDGIGKTNSAAHRFTVASPKRRR